MKKVYLALEEIETEGLQTRATIDLLAVRDYAEAEAERGAVFPPVTVYSDGTKHWLADGFHRVAMARQQGKKKIAAEVREGARIDALRHALGANGEHGLRRTNADKANAVKMAYKNRIELGLPDVPSAKMIGDLVGIRHETAAVHLANFATWRDAQERTGTDGKTYNLPPPPVRNRPPEAPPERAPQTDPGPPPVRRSVPPASPAETAAPSDGMTDGTGVPVPPTTPPVRRRTVPADDPAMTDGRGRPIPPELAEIWNRRREVAEMARLVGQVRTAVKAAEAGEDPLWAEINYSSALAYLDRSYAEIAAAMPWCVCPMCQGIGCRACKGRGLLGKTRYEAVVPRELKEKS